MLFNLIGSSVVPRLYSVIINTLKRHECDDTSTYTYLNSSYFVSEGMQFLVDETAISVEIS